MDGMTKDSAKPKQFSAKGTNLEALQYLSSRQTTSHGNQRFVVPTHKEIMDGQKGTENTEQLYTVTAKCSLSVRHNLGGFLG